MPARSSTAVRMIEANGPERKYSPMRTARARENTVAMTRAISDVRSVPTTKGRDWNVFVTGSHSEPVRKRKPLATRAGREDSRREKKIAMSRTLTAIPPSTSSVRNAESDVRSLFTLSSPADALLQNRCAAEGDGTQDGFRLVHHGLGKLRIREGLGELLSVVRDPPEQLHHGFHLRLRAVVVVLILVDEDPGERRDRVPVRSLGVGEIHLRHVFGDRHIRGLA